VLLGPLVGSPVRPGQTLSSGSRDQENLLLPIGYKVIGFRPARRTSLR
jgi:hypothetical protein